MLTETYSDKETLEFGKKLGESAIPGMIICLDGDLGTGKTVIAKGIALGLGITEPVSSPTFTVVKEYHEGRLPLYHFDVYRIADESEMDETGFEDYISGEGITLVEWADRIRDLMPKDTTWIRMFKDPEVDPDYRRLEIEDTGD